MHEARDQKLNHTGLDRHLHLKGTSAYWRPWVMASVWVYAQIYAENGPFSADFRPFSGVFGPIELPKSIDIGFSGSKS